MRTAKKLKLGLIHRIPDPEVLLERALHSESQGLPLSALEELILEEFRATETENRENGRDSGLAAAKG
jgi:hypothetical protein